MFSERSTQGSPQVASLIALGRFKNKPLLHHAGMVGRRGVSAELSDERLARHLVEVALLAADERDFRLAEHLVDVAYHLEIGE